MGCSVQVFSFDRFREIKKSYNKYSNINIVFWFITCSIVVNTEDKNMDALMVILGPITSIHLVKNN